VHIYVIVLNVFWHGTKVEVSFYSTCQKQVNK
jgi:hypothetical protein